MPSLNIEHLAILVAAIGSLVVALVGWQKQRSDATMSLLDQYSKRLDSVADNVCELEKKVMTLQDENHSLRERVIQLEKLVAELRIENGHLRDGLADLRDENDELKVGVTILIEQLRVLGAAPEWRPRPRKTQVKPIAT